MSKFVIFDRLTDEEGTKFNDWYYETIFNDDNNKYFNIPILNIEDNKEYEELYKKFKNKGLE